MSPLTWPRRRSLKKQGTIGILAARTYDSTTNRANLKALAFQAVNQTNGYLPDVSLQRPPSNKRSLREGHYVAWAHVFYLTKVASTDAGVSVRSTRNAKLFIDILTNTARFRHSVYAGSQFALVAQKGIVPLCAMTVTRSHREVAIFSLSPPPDPCGCYFGASSNTATVPASCVTCTTSALLQREAPLADWLTAKLTMAALPAERSAALLQAEPTHAQNHQQTPALLWARFQADNIPTP